jgi:uncharacterized protein (TIGR02996 family)
LLEVIVADPDDLEVRRVYADQLLARGDPRGAFIQAQCAGVREVADALLAKHFAEWTQAFGPTADVTFVNGFVEHWRCDAPTFFARVGRVRRKHPLRRLTISGVNERYLRALMTSTAFLEMRELELVQLEVWPFQAFAAAELPRLRRLVLEGTPDGRSSAFVGMLHQAWFANVRELGIGLELDPREVDALRGPLLQLEELRMRGDVPRWEAPKLERLSASHLSEGHGNASLESLLRFYAPKVRALEVSRSDVGPRLVQALLELTKLERVKLLDCRMSERDRAAVAERFGVQP